ncbi:MAG: HupE/UreJ family protein [Pseudomonadota bacterium]
MSALRLALLFFIAACCAPALAHKPSDSYLTLEVKAQHIDGQWDIALRDLDFAIGLDANGDGELTWDEVRARHADIAAYALARLSIGDGKTNCPLVAGQQLIDDHTDGAYAVLRFSAQCPAPVDVLTLDYRLLFDVDPQHKGLLKLNHGGVTDSAIFSPDAARQQFTMAAPDKLRQFGTYLKTGVWHIWIGFDHILFLLSLLLPAVLVWRERRWQPAPDLRGSAIDVLKIVTAFTLAHSITLTLATLDVIALPSRWVESVIAASVVLAALNNMIPVLQQRRWMAAFGFGLVHGFGFASVLSDLGLPRGALLLALVGFNAGVELGQLAIVALFLPCAYLLRHGLFYRRVVLYGGSTAIACIATLWLAERALNIKLPGL